MTLVRWDTGYYRNVGPIKHRIVDYKNIWGYVRDLYSLPVFKKYTFLNERPPRKPGKGGLAGRPFSSYDEKIAPQIDYEKRWATDGERRKLSKTPDEVFLRHPKGETYEEYASEISTTIWNSPDQKARNPKNGVLSVDASINPLKGKL